MTERIEVAVIGGGQAGLTAGYYLARAGVPFVILDARSRAGESWRSRCDSLTLFTTARYSSLPGLSFPGDPEHFPTKEEVADYLERYVQTFELPVRHNSRVTSLEVTEGGFVLETSTGKYKAKQVIVATGAYQVPYVPPLAQHFSEDVVQRHSAAYRDPDQIPGGTVLVVGAANSGAGIAEDLASTHRVILSQGARVPRLPRRLVGKSLHFWGDHLGLIGASLDSWRGRTQRGDLLVGPSLRQLSRRHGIQLAPRTTGAHGHTARFEDGTEVHVDAVVWATGFRSDYSWIDIPVFDPDGMPRHRRGVTDANGLYFLGMKNQHSRGSSLIHWVKDDAAFIVDQVCHARSPQRAGAPRSFACSAAA